MGFFGILGVKTETSIFLNPKRHFLAPKHAFWRIIYPNRSTTVICQEFQETKKKKGHLYPSMLGYAREVVCKPIPMKFGSLVDDRDVMKCAKFHRPRSLRFGIIVVQSWRFYAFSFMTLTTSRLPSRMWLLISKPGSC